jgi:hypothetical protein
MFLATDSYSKEPSRDAPGHLRRSFGGRERSLRKSRAIAQIGGQTSARFLLVRFASFLLLGRREGRLTWRDFETINPLQSEHCSEY